MPPKRNPKANPAILDRDTMDDCRHLRSVVADIPGVIFQYVISADGDGEFTYISPGFSEIYEIEAIDKKRLFELIWGVDDGENSADIISPSRSYQRQWQYVNPGGQIKLLLTRARPKKGEKNEIVWNGTVVELAGDRTLELNDQYNADFLHNGQYLFDKTLGYNPDEFLKPSRRKLLIAVQKRISEWLKNRREIARLFDHIIDLVAILNPEGKIKFLNPAWERAIGRDLNELIDGQFSELVPDEDRDRVLAEFENLKRGNIATFDTQFLSQNGAKKWMSWTFVPVLDFDAIYGVGRDITENKAIEQKLREREELFRTVADFTYDWEYWIDPDGKMRYISPSCDRITGYPAAAFLADPTLLEKIIFADDRDRVLAHLNGESTEDEGVEFDFRIVTRDDKIRWIGHICWPIYDEAGRYRGRRASNRDITERKETEKATMRLTRDLKMAQHIAHVGNWEYNVATQEINWSEELFHIFGLAETKTSPTFKKLLQLIHPEDREMWLQKVERALSEGVSYEIDHRIIRPDGEIRYIHGRGEVVRNEAGQVLRLFETAMDITDRKTAEIDLRDREQFLTSIYDGIEQAIFVIDLTPDNDFRYVSWNPATEQITGIKSEQIRGQTPEAIFDPEYAEIFRYHYQDCIDRGTSVCYEETVNWNNKEIFVLTTLNPIFDESGRMYRIVGTSFDINDRKTMENNLRRSEAQLRALAERETLQNFITDLIRNSLDPDTVLLTTVLEIRRILDIDRTYFVWYRTDSEPPEWEVRKEAKINTLPSITELYPGDALHPVSQYVLAGELIQIDDIITCTTPAIRNFFLVLEFNSVLILPIQTQQQKKGALVLAHCQDIRPWTKSEVELLEAIANQLVIALNQAELYTETQEAALIARAKTEALKQTLHQLQQAQVQLVQSEKMSSLGQMVAGIAHEINNPVSFIYGNITHAQEYTKDLVGLIELYQKHYSETDPEIEDEIEAIDLEFLIEDYPRIYKSMKTGADRIRDIVKSLRTFARLDESEVKDIDLHENIDSTLTILETRFKEKPKHPAIQIQKQYGELPRIECYAGQLNQVLLNLFNNAIDAIHDRDRDRSLEDIISDPSCIWISTILTEAKTVQIRIADNGVGMSPETVAKIFDPFYTTKPVGAGTGLGLSTSYQIIVEKHGGSLRCVSQEGVGTEFAIEIPLTLPHRPPEPQ
ncbi:MAG: PAS domain S-box protein [Limnospira sp.]